MVIEDEAGNAVEEVEVQVTRRPAGMDPGDIAALEEGDFDDLND